MPIVERRPTSPDEVAAIYEAYGIPEGTPEDQAYIVKPRRKIIPECLLEVLLK